MSRNLIIAVLKILAAEPGISELKRIAQEIIDKFFPELELPEFKIVRNTVPKWLGMCTTSHKDNRYATTIQIQKAILGDAKTLHRVLAHELIHYWELSNPEYFDKSLELKKYRIHHNPHGKTFKSMADKINAVYGKEYVTETSNLSYTLNETQEFFIIIQPFDKKYGVTKAIRPSKNQKIEIAKRIAEDNGHVFKTRDLAFHNTANIDKYGGFSVYKDDNIQTKLAELYASKNVDDLFKRVN